MIISTKSTIDSEIFTRTFWLIFANWLAREFKVLANKVYIDYMGHMGTRSRNEELANKSEIENLQNKSHAKISEFTVFLFCTLKTYKSVNFICTGLSEMSNFVNGGLKFSTKPDNFDEIIHFYAPNFEKVGRAYCFRLVCLSVCACVRLLTFEW